jgi:hypothetical protein
LHPISKVVYTLALRRSEPDALIYQETAVAEDGRASREVIMHFSAGVVILVPKSAPHPPPHQMKIVLEF